MVALIQSKNELNMKLLTTTLLLAICSMLSHGQEITKTIDLTAKANSEIQRTDLFSNIQLISLQTTDQCLIGRINKIIEADNHFFIYDSKQEQILVFKEDGTYLNRIGKIGRGPNEYTSFDDFAVDTQHKQIALLTGGKKVIIYNYDGTFVSKKQLTSDGELESFEKTPTGYAASGNHRANTRNNEGSLIHFYDSDLKLTQKYIKNNRYPVSIPPFSPPFLCYKDQVHYCDFGMSRLYLNINHKNRCKHIDFTIGAAEALPKDFSDAMTFMTKQQEYNFLISCFLSENIFCAYYKYGSEVRLMLLNTINNKSSIYKWKGHVHFYSQTSGNILTDIQAINLEEIKAELHPQLTLKYPVDENSNPMIMRCKIRQKFIDELNE